MNSISHNLRLGILILLGATLTFLYPVSILAMDHGNIHAGHTTPHTALTGESLVSHLPTNNSEQCVNFHLTLLEKLSQSTPQLPVTLMLLAAVLVALSVVGLQSIKGFIDYLQSLSLLKQQRLKTISLIAYMDELGHWLAQLQQKSPAYAFAHA